MAGVYKRYGANATGLDPEALHPGRVGYVCILAGIGISTGVQWAEQLGVGVSQAAYVGLLGLSLFLGLAALVFFLYGARDEIQQIETLE